MLPNRKRNEEELAKRLMTSLDDFCRPVVFIDSGLGGIPYLLWAMENIKNEHFIYIADKKNFPYGVKTAGELKKIILEVVDNAIKQFNPKLIVVACNTASVVAIEALRDTFEIPFVGVVPAIKPAASVSRNRIIGVLATERTIRDMYTQALIDEFAFDCEVLRVPAKGIVDFVELEFVTADKDQKIAAVKSEVDYCSSHGADTIVLGCTHFVFLKKEISELAGPNVSVIDSRDGVGHQMQRILRYIRCKEKFCCENTKTEFYHTGKDSYNAEYVRFLEDLGLSFCGEL
ncbi:glutamate racemase [Spirochaetia bacterium 38H-sp]|uniref:Glutamate racemase n=1 Tax=Rarispira pelagica TaxID=3141764 RepID=A0ABU9UB64_9SPIR